MFLKNILVPIKMWFSCCIICCIWQTVHARCSASNRIIQCELVNSV